LATRQWWLRRRACWKRASGGRPSRRRYERVFVVARRRATRSAVRIWGNIGVFGGRPRARDDRVASAVSRVHGFAGGAARDGAVRRAIMGRLESATLLRHRPMRTTNVRTWLASSLALVGRRASSEPGHRSSHRAVEDGLSSSPLGAGSVEFSLTPRRS
jgi:hypothetical protein